MYSYFVLYTLLHCCVYRLHRYMLDDTTFYIQLIEVGIARSIISWAILVLNLNIAGSVKSSFYVRFFSQFHFAIYNKLIYLALLLIPVWLRSSYWRKDIKNIASSRWICTKIEHFVCMSFEIGKDFGPVKTW